MWKVFNDEENLFMLSVTKTDHGCNLVLTDFKFLWENQISAAALFADFQINNPSIISRVDEITCNLLKLVENLQDMNVSVNNITSTDVLLILEKKYSVLEHSVIQQNIVYKFKLTKQDQEKFKNTITIPTIQTVYFLEEQQKTLLSVIQKKDRELEEFRMEKGDISRDDLKTNAFDPIALNASNKNLFLNLFSDTNNRSFWRKFSDMNGEVQTTNLQIETQPWNNIKRKRVIHDGKTVAKKGTGISFKN